MTTMQRYIDMCEASPYLQDNWTRKCGSLVVFKETKEIMAFHRQSNVSGYYILVNEDGSSRLMTQDEWDRKLFTWIPNFQELHEMTNMRWDEFMRYCKEVIEERVEFSESSYNIEEEMEKWTLLEVGLMAVMKYNCNLQWIDAIWK